MEKFNVSTDIEQARLFINKEERKMHIITKVVICASVVNGLVLWRLMFDLAIKNGFSDTLSFILAALFCEVVISVFVILPWTKYLKKAKDYTVSKKIIEIVTGNYTILDFDTYIVPCIYYVDNNDPHKIVNTLLMNEYKKYGSLTDRESTIDLINFTVITNYNDKGGITWKNLQ